MATIVAPSKEDIYEEDIGYRSSVSEELLRKIAASVNAINRDALFPLGSPVSSFLPEDKFQLLTSNAWVLIQGQDITDTDLGQFMLNNGLAEGTVLLPDARGMAFVGVNNSRSDGKEIFTDIGLGGFLPGGVMNHDHGMKNLIGTGSSGAGNPGRLLSPIPYSAQWSATTTTDFAAWKTMNTGTGIHAQNTINSIGVNWFIKVWNNAQP